jgi:hypothetical protein
MYQALKPTEKNGFTVIDVSPDKLTFTMLLWRPPEPIEAMDTMQPHAKRKRVRGLVCL